MVVRYPNGDEAQYVMTVFDCKVVSGQVRPDMDETIRARFVAAQFDQLDTSRWTREVTAPALRAAGSHGLLAPEGTGIHALMNFVAGLSPSRLDVDGEEDALCAATTRTPACDGYI